MLVSFSVRMARVEELSRLVEKPEKRLREASVPSTPSSATCTAS